MSRTTKNINKVSGTVMSLSIRLIIYAIIVLVIVKGASIAYEFGHNIFYATSMEEAPGTDIEVSIEDGTDANAAAKLLADKGLIDNKFAFYVQSKFFDLSITPGEYTLNTSETSRQILEDLDAGPQDEDTTKEDQS